MILWNWLLALLLIGQACSVPDEDAAMVGYTNALIYFTGMWAAGLFGAWDDHKPGTRGPTIKRTRKNVDSIFRELGCYGERYYRMKEESFWKLHRILQKEINKQVSVIIFGIVFFASAHFAVIIFDIVFFVSAGAMFINRVAVGAQQVLRL